MPSKSKIGARLDTLGGYQQDRRTVLRSAAQARQQFLEQSFAIERTPSANEEVFVAVHDAFEGSPRVLDRVADHGDARKSLLDEFGRGLDNICLVCKRHLTARAQAWPQDRVRPVVVADAERSLALSRRCNLAVILPISGMMSLFIIPGIHCAARAHGVF